MYFDTHCHLNSEQLYENKDEFIKHALDNHVEMMVVVGYDLESSKKAVEIAKELKNTLYTYLETFLSKKFSLFLSEKGINTHIDDLPVLSIHRRDIIL